MLVCPECGAQPETLPPVEIRRLPLHDRTANLSENVDSRRTRISEPGNGAAHDSVAQTYTDRADSKSPAISPAVQVKGYEIIEEIGRGGMGVVYKARQEGLKRLVALKMILSAGHASAAELARFLIEAEAVARLHDPNIVQVYQVGDQDGRPFLALEFVEGGSLVERLDGTPVPPRLAARFVIQLAHAVQHAHEHGIIHRDLKPANILLTQARGPHGLGPRTGSEGARPAGAQTPPQGETKDREEHWLAAATPKITDFGLAKRLDSEAGETKSGAVMGTPSYMAPEQASGKRAEVGPASDIYSLGAILYELITGRPPFRGESPLDTMFLATTEEPVPPKRLQPTCPRDLETICLKCLAKEPTKRYASARHLADDLQRLLDGEPIQARPTSTWERGLKWSRRHPAGAALLGLSALLLVGMIGAGWYYSAEQHFQGLQLKSALAFAKQERDNAEKSKSDAEKAADETRKALEAAQKAARAEKEAKDRVEAEEFKARRLLYDAHMSLAQREWQMAHVDRVLQLLQEQTAPDRAEFRGFEWYYLDRLCHLEQQSLASASGIIWSLAFSPDGTQLVSAASSLLQGQAEVRLWDLKQGKPVLAFPHHFGRVSSVAFHPGGKLVGSAGMDLNPNPVVFIWEAKTGKIVSALYGHFGEIHGLAFSPDGKKVATACYDKTVRVWEVATGKPLLSFASEVNFNTVAFSPDNKRLAASGSDEVVKVWDITEGPASADQRLALTLKGHAGKVLSVAFSPDGEHIATTGYDHTVRLWKASTGESAMILRLDPAKVEHICFSPDGKLLAGSDDRSMIKLWNAQTGSEVRVYRGHSGAINSLEFAPRGGLLASAGSDGTIHVWDTTVEQEAMTLRGHFNIVRAVFQPGGERLASGGHDRFVRIWDANTGRALHSFEAHAGAVLSVAYHPQGRILASAGRDRMVRLWDTQTDGEWLTQPELRLAGALASGRTSALAALPWLLARAPLPRIVQNLRGHEDDVTCLAFTPDGRCLASGSVDRTVRIWDPESGALLRVVQHDAPISALAFSPDGKFLATATTEGKAVLLWEVIGTAGGLQVELRTKLRGNADHVTDLAFAPDSTHLAWSSVDGTVHVWDTKRDTAVAVLRGHKDAVNSLAFSPDGHRLASASDDLTVKLWDMLDMNNPEETLSLQGHTDKVVSVQFGPLGHRLASGSSNGTIKIWDARPRPTSSISR
jgi:WD40 repeat protein/serine/threonine protein kinase